METPILPDLEASMGEDGSDGVRALLGRHARPDDIADAVLLCVGGEARRVDPGVPNGVTPAPKI